jgi:hypothetical protein
MRRLALLGLVVLSVLAAGCFRVEMAIRLHDDGSGVMTLLAAVDEALVEAASSSGAPASTPLADITAEELPPGATIEEYRQDGFVGSRITVPFEAEDDVAAALEALFEQSAAGGPGETGSPGIEDLVFRRDGDGWRFEARMDAPSPGGTGAPDEAMARFFLRDASFKIRILLPGKVVEHNADEVGADGELVWDIDLLAEEPRVLAARSEAVRATRDFLPYAFGGGVLLVVLAGGAAALALRR